MVNLVNVLMLNLRHYPIVNSPKRLKAIGNGERDRRLDWETVDFFPEVSPSSVDSVQVSDTTGAQENYGSWDHKISNRQINFGHFSEVGEILYIREIRDKVFFF